MENIAIQNSRPIAVKLALIYFLVDRGVGTISEMFYGPWDMHIYYSIFGVGLVLDFVPLWFVFRRKNWARWFVAIFTLGYCCYDPFLWRRYHQTFSAIQSVWFWLSWFLDIIAVALLFHPSSSRWFRAQKLPPNTALEPTATAP